MPSPESSKNGGGSPVEQTTEPDQNYDNHENEIPQHISDDDENSQKLKKNQIFHQLMIPKKPQKTPKILHSKKNP